MSFMQPVVIRNEETLKVLVEDMQACVDKEESVPTSTYKYSETAEKALANAAEIQAEIEAKTIWEQGGHRIILFFGHLITLALSLDKTDGGKEWHLSMGLVMINGEPNRVPDKFANALAKGFFGSYTENNPPKQGFSNIRHFFSKQESANVPDKNATSPAAN